MNRKNLLLLAVIIAGTLAIMAGCTSPQFGAPGTTGTAITGRVATPESCFSDACDNPSITEGKPLPGATALFYGGNSGKLKIEGETECDGAFEVNTTGEGSYVLYVVREYPEGSGKYVVVKKGINNPRGDIGEANAYTTSQVIIWERANFLYGEDFVPFDASWYAQYDWKWSFAPAKLVLPVSEIPNLEPSTQLYNAVEEALSECRDPQEDNRVIHFADQIADATFGAPAGGGAAGGGGGGGGGGTVVTTYTLTMAVDPEGGGSTDPTVGEHTYNEGTVVDITATPADGYQFVNWEGDVANSNSATTTVTIDGNKTVTANFELIPPTQYTLTMAVDPEGGGSTDPTVGEHTYNEGTVVDITATPADGYQFVNWEGDVANSNSATTTVTIDGNKTVTANFEKKTCKISGYVTKCTPGNCHLQNGVKIYLDGNYVCMTTSNPQGYYEIPDVSYGSHTIKAVDGSENSTYWGEITITVNDTSCSSSNDITMTFH